MTAITPGGQKVARCYSHPPPVRYGGLPPGFGLGLGKLRYRTGGPGGLPPGLGFGLGKFRNLTGGPGACPLGSG